MPCSSNKCSSSKFSHSRGLIMAVAVLVPVAAHAAPLDGTTVAWGKAEVSYQQYRADALDCGHTGLATDIDHSDPVNTLRSASNEIEALDNRPMYVDVFKSGSGTASGGGAQVDANEVVERVHDEQAIAQSARPKEQYARIKQLMFVTIRRCMVEHGYTRFTLNDGQRAALHNIRDKAARRDFLYRLASDPVVLTKQKAADPL